LDVSPCWLAMTEFLKEWRGAIALALILLVILLVAAGVIMPYVAGKRAVCYVSAQRFNPPLEWRWNPLGWGDGCELLINGAWFPADLVQPSLTP
jgi:hypothetical protein